MAAQAAQDAAILKMLTELIDVCSFAVFDVVFRLTAFAYFAVALSCCACKRAQRTISSQCLRCASRLSSVSPVCVSLTVSLLCRKNDNTARYRARVWCRSSSRNSQYVKRDANHIKHRTIACAFVSVVISNNFCRSFFFVSAHNRMNRCWIWYGSPSRRTITLISCNTRHNKRKTPTNIGASSVALPKDFR